MGSRFFEICPAMTGEPHEGGECPHFADGPHRCRKEPKHGAATHDCVCGYEWHNWTMVGKTESSGVLFYTPGGTTDANT